MAVLTSLAIVVVAECRPQDQHRLESESARYEELVRVADALE
jgi:hypothetical protein